MGPIRLQLVLAVYDLRTLTMTEYVFERFPVRVGRGGENDLRLDASAVSRRHGAFRYRRGALLEYVDLRSTNGSYIDGLRAEPGEPTPVRDSNVITVSPFRITFQVRHGWSCGVVGAKTPVEVPVVDSSAISVWTETLARSEVMRRVRREHRPSDLLGRAAEVIEVLAESIVLHRWKLSPSRSPLRAPATPDEIVAYLIAPVDGEQRLRELRDILLEILGGATSGALS